MWSIGQKVVCVTGHSLGVVSKGETWTILGLSSCPHCGASWVDIGLGGARSIWCRIGCGKDSKSDGTWWLSAFLFAPLEEKSEVEHKPQREELSTVTYEDIEAFMEIANP
jgi:hypothetical protein